MADYSTRATVVLSINGKQAEKMLSMLEKDAKRLEKQIAAAASAGDKAKVDKLQRQLNSTKRMMDQIKNSTTNVERVLARLDKATPRELNRALKQLQQELNGIRRGTPAWDAHAAKIRQVKAEIQKLNSTLLTQQSLWARMNKWLNYCQTALLGIAAAVTGLIMAGRKAVSAYADMEEALANTQKYTRMTREDVVALNEEFKKMDTRIAREELNALAQEGGRLGYNTIQNVKEYVEAASVIKVALVDLGEGATQTIAKLSNIFGMEDLYGVREAMLKVGSTVNHLSQNCTASKPYIVEFAQRLAGIGSTAKMTIPEIMAFAATLDAHGQKVEMSATALQRTIMALFKDTVGMAKKVGLDAKEFTETLNKSTTEGVMKFLEALGKIGEDKALAVLSPLFQDLGLDGVRVSAVLSNLSSHLDFLRWQLGEAATAFKEGTSATKEYEIFNNTAQATIDKAKNRVHELAVELGEKLYPLMRHIYTSSSAFLRVLNGLVSFIYENRKALGALLAVIIAYNANMIIAKTVTVACSVSVAAVTAVQKAFRTAVILSRIAVIAFTHGLTGAKRAFDAMKASMISNPFGLIIAAVTALVIAIVKLADRTSEYAKKLKEASNVSKNFSSELSKGMRILDDTFGKLENLKKGTKEYNDIKEGIISQYGKYLKGLINERNEIVNLEAAYNRLAAAARLAAKERAIDTAKKATQDTYDEQFSGLAQQLMQSLLDSGMEYRDAAYLNNRVIIELQSTGTLSSGTVAQLQAIKGSLQDKWGWTTHPVNIANKMIEATTQFNEAMKGIDKINKDTNPFASQPTEMIRMFLDQYADSAERGLGGRVIIGDLNDNPTFRNVSAEELLELVEEARAILSLRESPSPDLVPGNPDFNPDDFQPYESEKDRKARLAKEKRDAIKARKEFKDELNAAKGVWEADSAENQAMYNAGLRSYADYMVQKNKLELKYYDDRKAIFEKWELQEDEDYQELLKKREEYVTNWNKKYSALQVEQLKRQQGIDEIDTQMEFYTPGSAIYQNEEALQQRLVAIRLDYLYKMRDIYKDESEQYMKYTAEIEELERSEMLRKQKRLAEKFEEWRRNYTRLSAQQQFEIEEQLVKKLYDEKRLSEEEYQTWLAKLRDKYRKQGYDAEANRESARTSTVGPGGKTIGFAVDVPTKRYEQLKRQADDALAEIEKRFKEGLITEEEYKEGLRQIGKELQNQIFDPVLSGLDSQTKMLAEAGLAWADFFKGISKTGKLNFDDLAQVAAATVAVMCAGLQTYSEFVSSQQDIELAKIEKKYDREIELAEGNSYKVKKAEKAKEEETQRIKVEYARKEFAIKVAMAIGQTAQNALMGYAAGLQAGFPMALWLAPLLAGLAAAQGAIQVSLLKKQQQAAEASYSEGGFTKPGRVDEPAGIVHAGEWVASQKLTQNPKTRPLLEALDYAQRTNTIGSITMADVSRSVTAPMMIAAQPQSQPVVVQPASTTVVVEQNREYAATMKKLADRLNEPFVTVNTVSGDLGIQKAQDDYEKLMRNKSPKSKK